MLEPIVRGEADISIGSRLRSGSGHRAQRATQGHFAALQRHHPTILGYPVRDAHCGCKALRSDLARDLIGRIEDDGWFFDTELLVLAWREGLRINEIPVRWVEDDDSRVRIMRTALDDLRGVWRLSRSATSDGSKVPGGHLWDGRGNATPHGAKEEGQAVDFDSYAVRYEEAVDQSVAFTGRDSDFFAARKVEVLEAIVRPEHGPLRALSVLDVGCGTGTTDRFFRPRVGCLHGVDVSEEMLAKARTNVPDAEYRWYDGEKLPFPDGSFDVVVTICVLHHVPVSKRFTFVSEMVRVTRADGVIAIFEHNPMNPLTRRAVNSCEFDQDAILLSTRESLDLLKDAGEIAPRVRQYLFTPFGGSIGRALDRGLSRVPLGGQYVAWARRSSDGKPSALTTRQSAVEERWPTS
jgi:ubiquinone/menaquinone biosynthesis C-methylase UbiE